MVALKQAAYLSPEDYIEAEKHSNIKHEYHDGEVYAMAGGSDAHAMVGKNIGFRLTEHLRGSGCRTYIFEMKSRIEAVNRYYYPDVIVTCDPRDERLQYEKKYPTLIVEVMSDSTEMKDRGEKFQHYRHLETLQEYVLVSQHQPLVEVFRKNESGFWVLHPFDEGDEVELLSVGLKTNIATFYEDVNFPAADATQEAATEAPD
ncbi:MAG: Uma2 family endonuclease [Cyanobacteria bacterium P01_D01_bin.14]